MQAASATGTAKLASPQPPDAAEQDRERRDRGGQAGQLGTAGGAEPVVGGRPDAEHLDRRDRPVGIRAGDPVEAVDEGVGADDASARPGRRARRSISSVAGWRRVAQPAPAAPAPGADRGHGERPEGEDRNRPGEPGEAVGEEDPPGERQRHQRRPPDPPRALTGAGVGSSARRRSRSWRKTAKARTKSASAVSLKAPWAK